jgi:hypothetical protein
MNMLQIVQAAAGELGIPQPSLVVGIKNTDTIQLLALLNGLGGDLQREYIWQALNKEYRFATQFLAATGVITAGSAVVTGLSSTSGLDATYQVLGTGVDNDVYVLSVDSASQVTLDTPASANGTVNLNFCKTKYPFPVDFDRLQDRTQWDKTQHWEMLGPETAQQWQWLKSGWISTGPRLRWRVLGSYFQTWPPIAKAERLGFEYVSNGWALGAGGVPQTSFLKDSDTCVFPDRLMVTGLKMRYQQAKGLGSDFVDQFDRLLSIAQGNDGGAATLSMAPGRLNTLIGWENIPDSGFGNFGN